LARIFHENDADLKPLEGKTVAVIGYGNQGHAHALNLRDSGVRVVVGQRKGSPRYDLAVSHGFQPVTAAEATRQADLLMILLPDEAQPAVYQAEIAPALRTGQTLAFAHGFAIHFRQIVPPPDVDVILVAPHGPGRQLRSEYEAGRGLVCQVAVHQDASGRALETALAYCKAIGGLRAGAILSTFAEETETDLFGEQVVLCGGLTSLVKAAFETLVDAGYQPEIAYMVCLHELSLIVELFVKGGLTGLDRAISNTAEYGGLTRGPRVIGPEARAEMKKALDEIRSGAFARDWLRENQAGLPLFNKLARADEQHLIEQIGREMRKLTEQFTTDEHG